MFRARLLAAVLVTALSVAALAGCTSGGHATSSAPETAWDRTLSRIGPDGSVDTATALAAFSLAIGPVPGASAPSGPAATIPSGTLAVQWVLGRWAQLAAAQQHAVLGDLGVVTTAALDRKPSPAPEIPCLAADVGATGTYRAQLSGIESELAGHIGGGPFTGDIHLSINNKQMVDSAAGLYTVPCAGTKAAAGGAAVTGCTIHVNPLVSKGNFPAGDVHDFLIHELVHCYLSLKLGAAYASLPAWYVEGVASWAQNTLGGGSNTETSYWRDYLNSPDKSLFSRDYDALGFFTHLTETGTDVWHRILPAGQAIKSGGSPAGWRTFAPGTAFLDSWGSGYAEGRYTGPAWHTGSPNLPTYQGPIAQGRVGDGQTVTVRSAAAGTAIRQLELDAQVVLVTSSGDGRFSLDDGADATLAAAAGAAYSTGSPGTACPAGTGASLTHISSGPHYVAVAGGLSAGQVSVQGLSLAAFCARQTARPCLVGHWTATNFHATNSRMTENGGAGVTMGITAAGAMSIDFDPMKQVTLSGPFEGGLTFSGHVTGQIVVPSAAQPGTAYPWHQAAGSTADYHSLTAEVHVTSPIDYTYGPVSVTALARQLDPHVSFVDSQPLSTGTWTCTGNTLVVRAPESVPSDGTWTWTRAG